MVLLIDDEITPTDPMVRLLERGGFGVECVPSGRDGLRRAFEAPWLTVLLDMHLPDVPGLAVLTELHRQRLGCLVIAISGWYLDSEYESTARRLGAADFRRKPLDAEDLIVCLRTTTAAWRQQAVPHPVVALQPGLTGGVTATPSRDDSEHDATIVRLHYRLLEGDTDAAEPMLACLLPHLVNRLQRRFRYSPGDCVIDAVEDALLEYIGRPARFDATRNVPLSAFLLRAAARNLINALESERRRRDREARYATDNGVITMSDPLLDAHDRPNALSGDVTIPSEEREAYELWRKGERRTEVFAQALGLSSLALADQRREVKRFKDRLLKRIRRHLES